MQANKDQSIKYVLQEEGGYTNDAADPGGPTNFGITIFDARMYLEPSLSAKAPWTAADIAFMRGMTVDQAIGIYGPKYWDAVRGDDLPSGLDYTIMDYAVNSGVGRAIPVLQRIVGEVDDGKLGPHTLAAVQSFVTRYGVDHLIDAVNDERLAFLQRLRTWRVFGKGWGRRVADVRSRSHAMVLATQKET